MNIGHRPSHDETGLQYAEVAQRRATCLRRAVGCCLTNVRNQVLATGYNGRAAGLAHCNEVVVAISDVDVNLYEHACKGMVDKHFVPIRIASGTMLDACEAIHAEQNALLQCGDVYSIHTCYVTHSPCLTCVKLLMNTGCKRIVFRERYAHDESAMRLWLAARGAELPFDGMNDRGSEYELTWLHLPSAAK